MFYIVDATESYVKFLTDRNKTMETWWSEDPELAMGYYDKYRADARATTLNKGNIKVIGKDTFDLYAEQYQTKKALMNE